MCTCAVVFGVFLVSIRFDVVCQFINGKYVLCLSFLSFPMSSKVVALGNLHKYARQSINLYAEGIELCGTYASLNYRIIHTAVMTANKIHGAY